MKALVTGGAGFIGSNLVDRLLADGHEVFVIDNLSTGDTGNLGDRAPLDACDVEDPFNVDKAFARWQPDVVFHLAALARIQPSIEQPLESHAANLTGTLNLLDKCRKYGVKRFVFSSSSSIYGETSELPAEEHHLPNPGSPYAAQKLACEYYGRVYANLFGIEFVALRYFNVYGERQILEGAYAALVGIFLQQKADGKPFTIVGDGLQRRDFTYVGDVVEANVRAATCENIGEGGTVINIGTGRNFSVLDVANLIDSEHPKDFKPPRPGECRETLADNTKAKQVLGWSPTVALADWIAKTVNKS